MVGDDHDKNIKDRIEVVLNIYHDKNIKQHKIEMVLTFLLSYCRILEFIESFFLILGQFLRQSKKKECFFCWRQLDNDEPNIRSQTKPIVIASIFCICIKYDTFREICPVIP